MWTADKRQGAPQGATVAEVGRYRLAVWYQHGGPDRRWCWSVMRSGGASVASGWASQEKRAQLCAEAVVGALGGRVRPDEAQP